MASPPASGERIHRAEVRAPGEGVDAIVWDELAARTDEDSRLTVTYLVFMVAATVLAAIGVITDSTIAVVGAMVVGPTTRGGCRSSPRWWRASWAWSR